MNIFAKLFKVNDSINIVYAIIMLLALFSPTIFFTENAGAYRTAVIMYAVAFAIIGYKATRIDISNNILKYAIYFVALFFIFGMIITSTNSTIPFRDNITKMVWLIFIVGFSESTIRAGLQEKIGSVIITSIVMGALHITSYMTILGITTFTPELILALFVSIIAFIGFYYVHKITRDLFIESLVHGIYDFFIMGGLILSLGAII